MTIGWRDDIRIGAKESLHHDLLRIFLILQVIVGHVVALTLPQMPALLSDPLGNGAEILLKFLTRFGPQAAYLFVFLSGYMIAGQLLHDLRAGRAVSFRSFVQRRLKKLLPGVFIGLVITAILDGLAIFALGRSAFYENLMGHNAVDHYRLDLFAANLLFLEPTFAPTFGSNGPLWTLGYIFQYYLAGFGLLLIARRRPWLGASTAALLLIAVGFIRPEWSILFVAWLVGGWVRNVGAERAPPLPLFGLAAILFVASNTLPPLYSAAASAFVGIPLVLSLQGSSAIRFHRAAPLIRALAVHSYLAYAVHFPILVFAAVFAVGIVTPLAAFAVVTSATCAGIILVVALERKFANRQTRPMEQP